MGLLACYWRCLAASRHLFGRWELLNCRRTPGQMSLPCLPPPWVPVGDLVVSGVFLASSACGHPLTGLILVPVALGNVLITTVPLA